MHQYGGPFGHQREYPDTGDTNRIGRGGVALAFAALLSLLFVTIDGSRAVRAAANGEGVVSIERGTPEMMTAAAARPAAAGGLQVQGRHLLDATGEIAQLRGADLLRSEWDLNMDFERQAFPELAAWGANVVKRGFASDPIIDPGFVWYGPGGQEVTHELYLSWLDEYVALAADHNMYVVLSWRSTTINGPQPPMPDAGASQALATLAARYRDQPQVILSLQEEPHDVSWDALQPMFQAMTNAIYAAAAPAQPLVIVPGTDWSRELGAALANPVIGPNVIYKTHPHNDQSLFARQFINAYERGLPVLIGNFGPVEFGGAYDSDLDDVAVLLEWAETNKVGWIAWMFDEGGGPALISDNTTMTPTPYGSMVRDAMGAGAG